MRFPKIAHWGLVYGLSLVFAIAGALSLPADVQAAAFPAYDLQQEDPAPDVDAPSSIYMPMLSRDLRPLGTRIGVDMLGSVNDYPITKQLGAGWYTDWRVTVNPPRPNQIEYVQTIRVHQKLSCGAWFYADRTACPYAQPYDYVYQPDQFTLEAAIRANPGSTWFVGNEIDRRDWSECTEYQSDGVTCVPGKIGHVGQDEMLPETYARAYHDLYMLVKSVDPTAKVGIAGLIQATPLRLAYLTRIWNEYRAVYGSDMPVDVWNIHAFTLREVSGEYGAEIPPGFTDKKGSHLEADQKTHMNTDIFAKQIRDMRQWMKDRGQQEKPLVVSEYGVLYRHAGMDNETTVNNFMLWTFNYFLNTSDCALGYTADNCRLVQRWAWFAVDTTSQAPDGSLLSAINTYTSLFNTTTKAAMNAGVLYANFVTTNLAALRVPVP